MMSGTEQAKWEKLNVIQLKGALARRGLAGAGPKDELVARLKEYELKQENGEKEKNEKKSETRKPMFTKKYELYNGYLANMSVKTVIIEPFTYDMFQDANIVTWLNECKSFTIQKNHKGDMAAELLFQSCAAGEVACGDLQSNLEEVKVYHPMTGFVEKDLDVIKIEAQLEKLLKTKPTGEFWSRLLALEGLTPSMHTEEKLLEFFPEAYNIISNPCGSGITGLAVLEFFSVEDCNNYMKTVGKEPLEMDDARVKVSKFLDVFQDWSKTHADQVNLKRKIEQSKDIMDDKKRILLNHELIKLRNFVTSMESFEVESTRDVQDKLYKFNSNLEKFEERKRSLESDTAKRLKKKNSKLPENEDDYLEITVNALIKENPDTKLTKWNKYFEKIQKELKYVDELYEQARKEAERLRTVKQRTEDKLPKNEKKTKTTGSKTRQNMEESKSTSRRSDTSKSSAKKSHTPDKAKQHKSPAIASENKERTRPEKRPVATATKRPATDVPEMFIGNLPPKMTEPLLRQSLNKEFPGAHEIRIPTKGGEIQGFAFMNFKSESQVDAYIKKDVYLSRQRLRLEKNIKTRPVKIASGAVCFNCQKGGHYARDCPNKLDEPPSKIKRTGRSLEREHQARGHEDRRHSGVHERSSRQRYDDRPQDHIDERMDRSIYEHMSRRLGDQLEGVNVDPTGSRIDEHYRIELERQAYNDTMDSRNDQMDRRNIDYSRDRVMDDMMDKRHMDERMYDGIDRGMDVTIDDMVDRRFDDRTDRRLDEVERRMDGQIDRRMDDRVDDRIDRRMDDRVDDRIDRRMDDRVDDRIDRRMDDRVDDRIDRRMDDRVDDRIDRRMDDRVDDRIDRRMDDRVDDRIDRRTDDRIDSRMDRSRDDRTDQFDKFDTDERIDRRLDDRNSQLRDGRDGDKRGPVSNESLMLLQGITSTLSEKMKQLETLQLRKSQTPQHLLRGDEGSRAAERGADGSHMMHRGGSTGGLPREAELIMQDLMGNTGPKGPLQGVRDNIGSTGSGYGAERGGGHGGNAVPRAQLQQPNHSRPEHDSSRHPATYNSPYPFTASSKSTGKGKIVEYNTKNYKAGDSILPTPSPNKSGDSILPIPHLSTRSQHGSENTQHLHMGTSTKSQVAPLLPVPVRYHTTPHTQHHAPSAYSNMGAAAVPSSQMSYAQHPQMATAYGQRVVPKPPGYGQRNM